MAERRATSRLSRNAPAATCRRQPDALGRERAQQVHVGEPHRERAAAELPPDVARRPAASTGSSASSHHGCRKRIIGCVPLVRACRWAATNRTMSSSQSESVRSRRWAAPAPRSARGDLGRAGRRPPRRTGGAARGSAVCTSCSCAGLRVDEREHADVGQLQLARVDDLDRQHVVADAELAQRPGPLLDRRPGSRRSPRPGRAGAAAGCSMSIERAEVGAGRAGRGRRRDRAAAGPARPCGRGAGRQPAHGRASPVPTTAPIRLPPRTVRWVIAAAAAIARSRLR